LCHSRADAVSRTDFAPSWKRCSRSMYVRSSWSVRTLAHAFSLRWIRVRTSWSTARPAGVISAIWPRRSDGFGERRTNPRRWSESSTPVTVARVTINRSLRAGFRPPVHRVQCRGIPGVRQGASRLGVPRRHPRAAQRHVDRSPDEPLADGVTPARDCRDHRRDRQGVGIVESAAEPGLRRRGPGASRTSGRDQAPGLRRARSRRRAGRRAK